MAGALYLGSSRVFPMHAAKEPANLDALVVNPTTSTQVINATGITDGFNTVTVNAVTNAIDPGIAPSNIRNSITILGVTGTYEGDVEKVLQEVIAGNNPVNVATISAAESFLNTIATRT